MSSMRADSGISAKNNNKPARDEPSILVSLQNIRNCFGTHVVHENLSLDILQGEILGLIGGSGTGKSVLLRTILGLGRQQEGRIVIMGVDMAEASAEARARVRNSWGVLFQDGALFSSLTVLENVVFPLREFTRVSAALAKDIAIMKLSMVGLAASTAGLYPSELSGGMRKRVGLARALVMDPLLLLLDEPTAGLDPIGAAAFDELLLTMKKNLDLTVCMVTHDLDTLHATCDRVAVLAEKHIVAVDSLSGLVHNQYPWIQEYFGGPRGRAAGFV